ncbi:uncharacterized protein LOC144446889 [Glandiceps talaboti]
MIVLMINLFTMILTGRLYILLILIGLMAGTIAGKNEHCPQRRIPKTFRIFGYVATICPNRNKCTTNGDCAREEHCKCINNCGKVCVNKPKTSPVLPSIAAVTDMSSTQQHVTVQRPSPTPEYCPEPKYKAVIILGFRTRVCENATYCHHDNECEQSEYCKCTTLCGKLCATRPPPTPGVPKPGQCPPEMRKHSIFFRRNNNCRYDITCPGEKKCCLTSNGRRCLQPDIGIPVTIAKTTRRTATMNQTDGLSIKVNDTLINKNDSNEEPHPCTYIECGEGELCQVSMDTKEAECVEEQECEDYEAIRVCGSDNITYPSICDLKKNKEVKIRHLGKCRLDGQPRLNVSALPHKPDVVRQSPTNGTTLLITEEKLLIQSGER